MKHRHLVHHIDQLESIRDEWEDIRRNNSCGNPLLSFEYLRLWYRCFAGKDQIRVYRISDGNNLIGFLPLILETRRKFRRLKPLTTIHSPHSDPLILKGHEERFSPLALSQLLADSGSWDSLMQDFSYSFSPLPGLFSDELLQSAGIRWRRWIQPTYLIQLDRSFQDYCSHHLSAKERKNVRQYTRRLEKAGTWKVLSYQGREAEKMWPAFLDVERSGWKGASRSAIDQLEKQWRSYYEGLLQILLQHDALLLHFLQLEDALIASAFGYKLGNMYHGLKIAHDAAFRRLSPGNIIILHLIEDLVTRHPGIRFCHMFPEDHGFKHRYANVEATCLTSLLYGRTLRGRTLYRLTQAKRRLRRLPGMSAAADLVATRKKRQRRPG